MGEGFNHLNDNELNLLERISSSVGETATSAMLQSPVRYHITPLL